MEAEKFDAISIGIPLLVHDNRSNIDDVVVTCSADLQPPHHHHDAITTAAAASFFNTFFNGLNALSGVGILSIPYALASGGWLSLILLLFIAIAAFYSGLLIKRCMDADSNIRTYPDIGAHAFGNVGRVLVSIFTNAELYLVITGFLIVEGDNLHNLFPHMEVEVAGMRIGGKLGFIILVAIVILPTVWVDNLSLLSYISASGVLASAIILGSIFWTGAFDGVGFQQKGTLINWKGLPTAVSLYAFCYCAHPVFPDMYTSMKSRHQFSIVLFLCFTLCTICYAAMAVLGYLMFGSDVQSQVTLNLPVEKFSSRLAIYTTLVNPIAKYALMMTPVVKSIRPRLPYRCNKKAFSSAIMISTVIVALTVPFFGQLMSLVGAFLSMSASIVIPCLCYLKISGAYRRFQFEVVVILGVLVLAVMVGILGTYTAILQIVGNF